jgi:hypothetical protein
MSDINEILNLMAQQLTASITTLLSTDPLREPGWRTEDPDELIATWVITPDPKRILRLCWVADEFHVVSDTEVSSALAADDWQKNMFAVIGFCEVHGVGYHWMEWPGIEGMRDALKDC